MPSRPVPDPEDNPTQHISVCTCTYKRPHLLKRLLQELDTQETSGLFTYSIVVTDNDHLRSAQPIVADFATGATIPITYCVEPRQNIALARNKAIENAHGDFIAFIDDDEFPTSSWLLTLFKACHEYGVDGVLGPVRPHFDEKAPEWVVKGKFYERRTYPTGFVIDWTQGRTGNMLLKSEIFDLGELPFRPEFRIAEDQDFFRRMIEKGHTFIWCDAAVAYEVEPPIRWTRRFMLRRALLGGTTSVLHPSFGARDIAKSVIAIPVYAAALPFALVLGQHRFMYLLTRLFNHLGILLGCFDINPIKEPYVTD